MECAPPGGGGAVCVREKFNLKEIWAQDNIYIYICIHFAWLKYFTYHLLLSVQAPNYKQHILSPAKVSFLSVLQHAI
jgi:hypothetical protein